MSHGQTRTAAAGAQGSALSHGARWPREETEAMLERAAAELKDAQLSLFTARHRLGAAVSAGVLSARAVLGHSGVDQGEGDLEALMSAADLLALNGAWRAEALSLTHPQRIDEQEAADAVKWAMEAHIAAKLYVMGAGA